MRCDVVYPALNEHLRRFFAGHRLKEFVWTAGPTQRVLPRFRVVRVAPGRKSRAWVYLSVGAWEVDHDAEQGLEALEQRFQEARIQFADPGRASVV